MESDISVSTVDQWSNWLLSLSHHQLQQYRLAVYFALHKVIRQTGVCCIPVVWVAAHLLITSCSSIGLWCTLSGHMMACVKCWPVIYFDNDNEKSFDPGWEKNSTKWNHLSHSIFVFCTQYKSENFKPVIANPLAFDTVWPEQLCMLRVVLAYEEEKDLRRTSWMLFWNLCW